MKVLFSILLVCIPLLFSAQSTISGQILDAETNEPLTGTSILVIQTNSGTITDNDGSFILQTEAKLPLQIRVSYVGYQTQELNIDSQANLIIYLVPSSVLEETIVVSASRKKEKLSEAPASISVLESRKLTSAAVTNPVQHLRNVSGLQLNTQGVDHYQISLRGRANSFYSDTYYLQDYRTLVSPGTGVAMLSRTTLNDLDLDRIEVIRGPGSALYGPGVETGVIHFITKSPFRTGTDISLTAGTQSSLGVAMRHAQQLSDKFAFKVLGYYNRAEDFVLDPTDSTDLESINSFVPTIISALDGRILLEENTSIAAQTENYGINGTLEYRFNDNTSLTSSTGWAYRKGIARATLGEAHQDHPDYYTQLRLSSRNFFIQGFINVLNNVNEKGYLYRTGLSAVTKNVGYQLQGQYLWNNLINNLDLAVGSELQINTSETQGTVHGRYENDDAFRIYSAYTQATYNLTDQFEFVAAGRVDRFSAVDETAFSPRLAFVYKMSPTQNFRITYNRAISSPPALDIYADIPFGSTPIFDIQFIGGIEPITYSDPLITTSLLPGVGEYSGTDIPLAIPYSIAIGALSSGLTQEQADYLNSLIGQINTNSSGALLVNGQIASSLPTREPLVSTKTSSYEIGYKGVFGSKLSVNLDIYYNKRKDLVFSGEASPLVLYPTLASDLSATFNNISDPQTLQDLGLNQAALSTQIEAIGADLAANPLGLVEPSIAADSAIPQFIISRYNLGEIDYFGSDLGLTYYINDDFSLFTNFSWVSKNTWNDEELGASGTGQSFNLNIPDKILKVGFDKFAEEKGFGYNASLRYQSSVAIQEGSIFVGDLDAYTIIDAGVSYNFGQGTKINLSAMNLLDNAYRVMPRMPKIGALYLINIRHSL